MNDEEKRSPVEKVVEVLGLNPGSTAEQLAERCGLGQSTVRKALVRLESEGRASRTAGGREEGRKLPDSWTLLAAEEGRPPAEMKKKDRLPKGRLAELVLAHLRTVGGQPQSPAAVGKAIGHSAGAISNALRKMAESGEVKEVSSKPKRYTIGA